MNHISTPEFWVFAAFLLFVGFIILQFRTPLLHLLETYQEDIETHLLEHKSQLKKAKATLTFAKERVDDLADHLSKLKNLFKDQRQTLQENHDKKVAMITQKLLMKEQATLNQVRSQFSSRLERIIVSAIIATIEQQTRSKPNSDVQKDLLRIFATPLSHE